MLVSPLRNHSSSWMMLFRCTFLVVTSGKPSARSNRIWGPNTDTVPVPVRSVFTVPVSRMWRSRAWYWRMRNWAKSRNWRLQGYLNAKNTRRRLRSQRRGPAREQGQQPVFAGAGVAVVAVAAFFVVGHQAGRQQQGHGRRGRLAAQAHFGG